MRRTRAPRAAAIFGFAGAACIGSIDGRETGAGGAATPEEHAGAPAGGAGAPPGAGAPGGSTAPGAPGSAAGTGPGAPPPPGRELAAVAGLRRLTAHEYDNTLRDLLGDTTRASHLLLPEDVRNPFDNDYAFQISSKALVEGVDLLARDAAERLLADGGRRDRIVGCKPAGATDDGCLRSFVTRVGRRALRRPLAADEIQQLVALGTAAQRGGDFYAGVADVVRALLQDPEFLYRVEVGAPVPEAPGIARLGPFELAARIAYLLWGSMPDDALLDRAQARRLETPADVRAAAAALLADARARDRVARFHAMWLGYETLPHGAELGAAMKAETTGLVNRVVFQERRPWQDLFRMTETFAGDLLARHYGLPPPGSREPVWIPYGASKRRGLLSHGSLLSVGAKFGDTSPVERGLFVRTRLFCQEIPPPPPVVNTDEAPTSAASPCKWDRYAEHRSAEGCASCHRLIDPVGFGLENYDDQGRFRAAEKGLPQCRISGDGELVGVGAFNGPAQLAELALKSGVLSSCALTQIHRFAVGRTELDETDRRLAALLADLVGAGKDFRLDEVLLDYVASPAFAHKREEKVER